jgi:isoleucyl-tRNA synthetase
MSSAVSDETNMKCDTTVSIASSEEVQVKATVSKPESSTTTIAKLWESVLEDQVDYLRLHKVSEKVLDSFIKEIRCNIRVTEAFVEKQLNNCYKTGLQAKLAEAGMACAPELSDNIVQVVLQCTKAAEIMKCDIFQLATTAATVRSEASYYSQDILKWSKKVSSIQTELDQANESFIALKNSVKQITVDNDELNRQKAEMQLQIETLSNEIEKSKMKLLQANGTVATESRKDNNCLELNSTDNAMSSTKNESDSCAYERLILAMRFKNLPAL